MLITIILLSLSAIAFSIGILCCVEAQKTVDDIVRYDELRIETSQLYNKYNFK